MCQLPVPLLHSQPEGCSLGLEEGAGDRGVPISSPELWVRELKVVRDWVKPPGRAGLGARGRREDTAPRASLPALEPDAGLPFLAQGRPLVAAVGRAGQGDIRAGKDSPQPRLPSRSSRGYGLSPRGLCWLAMPRNPSPRSHTHKTQQRELRE